MPKRERAALHEAGSGVGCGVGAASTPPCASKLGGRGRPHDRHPCGGAASPAASASASLPRYSTANGPRLTVDAAAGLRRVVHADGSAPARTRGPWRGGTLAVVGLAGARLKVFDVRFAWRTDDGDGGGGGGGGGGGAVLLIRPAAQYYDAFFVAAFGFTLPDGRGAAASGGYSAERVIAVQLGAVRDETGAALASVSVQQQQRHQLQRHEEKGFGWAAGGKLCSELEEDALEQEGRYELAMGNLGST